MTPLDKSDSHNHIAMTQADATNLRFLEQLAWKAWRDGWIDAGGEISAHARASFNLWWGWQAATIEHGDWSPER